MRFIVYAAGAIGSVVGGYLFKKGYNAVLVANPRHADKIRESGLKLVTAEETYVIPIPAFPEARELLPFREDDVLLVTAKSQHTLRCLGQLKNAGAPRTLPIVCLQNAICNEALATRVFDRIYGGFLMLPTMFLEPGTVVNMAGGGQGFIEIGLYPRGSDDLAARISKALRDSGFGGGVNDWVMRTKAAKCLFNLRNALEAITGRREGGEKYMAEARKEALDVWTAAGIEWEDPESFATRVKIRRDGEKRKEVKGQTGMGSSWQSLMRKTGNIEAEELNGDVVKLGQLVGVPAPYNELLWKIAEEMASQKELPGKYTVGELMEMVKIGSPR